MRIALVCMLFLCISCSGIKKATKIQQHIVSSPQHVGPANSTDSIGLYYTGCGGFLIQGDGASILLDPYFSNVSPLLGVPFKRLRSDTELIDSFFKKVFNQPVDEDGEIKAVLVAHSHYDHLADVPAVYLRNCNPDTTLIIGSKTTQHILHGAGITSKVWNLGASATEQETMAAGQNIYTENGRIRILPIISKHAPHFLCMKFLSCRKLKKDRKRFPRSATRFPEGENYNFLIDFLDKSGAIKFRIFSNAGSACNGGVGFPSTEVLQEKPVDVLLLCVASFNQVHDYPQELIAFIKPRHIVLNHWENFFRPIRELQKKPATVPATNVRKFIAELENSYVPSPHFTLPQPETKIVFYY